MNIIYFIVQKLFLCFVILETLLAYDHISSQFNSDANDKSRGIQLFGPGCLLRVLRGVN